MGKKNKQSKIENDNEKMTVPDGWKEPEFTKEDYKRGFTEKSSFGCLFPKYRENYIKESWPLVKQRLSNDFEIVAELELIEGSMIVSSTKKTWDPYAIINARDLIRLLARSVPYEKAITVMNDDVFCDIIKIGRLVNNRERFIRRRQRLVGTKGCTLKAIELLTECYVLVQGNTVSVIGNHKGIKKARKIVVDAMNNVHPVYTIKSLMVQKELENDDKLRNEDWSRFLPKFKKQNKKTTKIKIKNKKKELYPPLPPMSKIDKQLESGEFFMNKELQKKAIINRKKEQHKQKSKERINKRKQDFIAPSDPVIEPKKSKKN
ncbi:hypothetical protein A3Q56_02140 [Intoshia linei]|uniref:KRR1 small subunit processome component n=1 Tax=Intoshia linei TaxID=1819745 RepID=A0A177B7K7_9BILA|nr:hypothetical protein A3Q56_02140 [Intoshia linei]